MTPAELRSYYASREPTIDPTMHVYCPIHSEQPGRDVVRRGPVAASYGVLDYGQTGYRCWHCAHAEWKTGKAADR